MLALHTYSATHLPAGLETNKESQTVIFSLPRASTHCEHPGVVFTLVGVVVAVTFLALILHLPSGRSPGNILVEILTLLTVIAPKVSINVSQSDK